MRRERGRGMRRERKTGNEKGLGDMHRVGSGRDAMRSQWGDEKGEVERQ